MSRRQPRFPLGDERGDGWGNNPNWLINVLGDLGVRLVQQVIGGEICKNRDHDADLYHWELGAKIEIKTRSNNDRCAPREDQLNARLIDCEKGFPFPNCLYTFVKYNNRNTVGGRERLFQKKVRDEISARNFLARHVTGIFTIDISIVNAIRCCDTRRITTRHGDNFSPSLAIGWKFFNQLRIAPNEVLRSLSINPRSIKISYLENVMTNIEGRPVQVPMLFALPPALEKKRLRLSSLRTNLRKSA